MYKFVFFSVIACIALQGAFAKPRAKPNTTPAAQPSTIEELIGNARQYLQNNSVVIDSKTLNENIQKISSKISEAVQQLNNTINDPEHKKTTENIVNQVRDGLSSVVTKLQTAIGPEATAKASEIKANLDEGLNKTIAEIEKLAKAAEPEATKVKNDLTSLAKGVLDQVVEVSKTLKEKVEEQAKKN